MLAEKLSFLYTLGRNIGFDREGVDINRCEATFTCPVELGRRLRSLRRRAGLTQGELALLMGRTGQGSKSAVCRLERGQARYPSIGLLSDFLRGCRAGFSDITDVLDMYTAKPVVPEERAQYALMELVRYLPVPLQAAVVRYDVKTTLARSRPSEPRPKGDVIPAGRRMMPWTEPLEERLARLRNVAAGLARQELLERVLHKALGMRGMGTDIGTQHALARYGRRVFSVLSRTRGDDVKRMKRLGATHGRVGKAGLSVEPAGRVDDAVQALFFRMEQAGDLDRLPFVSHAETRSGKLRRRGVRRAESRLKQEQKVRDKQVRLFRFATGLWYMREGVQLFGGDGTRDLVQRFYYMALEAGSDSAELERRASEAYTRAARPDFCRTVAAWVFGKVDKSRRLLFPAKAGGSGTT